MDEATLKSKKVADLREIAKTFGLEGYAKMKKAELVSALMIDPEEPKEEKPAKAAPKETAKVSRAAKAAPRAKARTASKEPKE